MDPSQRLIRFNSSFPSTTGSQNCERSLLFDEPLAAESQCPPFLSIKSFGRWGILFGQVIIVESVWLSLLHGGSSDICNITQIEHPQILGLDGRKTALCLLLRFIRDHLDAMQYQ
jgi:hypothetical protein